MEGEAGPALPWASLPDALAQPQAGAQAVAPPAARAGDAGPLSEAPAAGTAIEWWSATVVGAEAGQADAAGRQVYMLRYAADPEAGFDEEATARVSILDDHHLFDLGEGEELPWRRQGEVWDTEQEPPEELVDVVAAAVQEAADGATLSMASVAERIRQEERRRGRTVEEECQELLRTLPAEQQRVVAAGFREFSDILNEGIKGLFQQHGPDYVITAEDIHRLRQQAMTRLSEGLLRGPPGLL
eukprot:scaffold5.g678.t1